MRPYQIQKILNDFSEVERAMKEIEQSAGSADKEMGIIEQSFDYKINALKETWVGFLTEIADRGALASLIDTLTKLSEVITGLLSQKGAIVGLLSVITGAIATKNNFGAVDIFDGIENGVNAAIDVAKNIPDIFDTFRASFTLGIKPEEIKDIRDAYNELKNGSDKTVDSFDNLSDKAKESLQAFLDLGNEGEDVDEVLNRMTDSSKAAAVAMDLLNTVLISIVVFAVTKTFQSIVTYESELAEQATNATNALRNQQQTIDTYSTRIQALYDKINSGQLTLDEHVEANRELREIQRELVDNFGNEASGIDLVTSSLEKQRDVLKDVNNLKISQYLQSEFENEFNKETDSQKWLNGIFTSLVGAGSTLFGGIITTTLFYDKLLQNYNETGNPFLSVQKYILGYENNLDEMESKFEDFSATISGTSDETLNKFIATYDNIRKLDNGDFEIFGNVNDVRDTIIHLQNDYKDMPGYTEKWANSLTQVWQKADDIYDKYGEIYNTRVEMAIASSDEYTAMQETLQSISDNYERAVIAGDQKKVDQLAQQYIDEVNHIRDTVISKAYQDAIINIVPEIADPDIAKAKVKLDELVDYYNDPTNFDGSKYVKEWEDVINGLLTNPDLNFEEYASSFDEFISNVQAMIEDGRELELGSILGEINYEGYDYSLDDLKKLVNIYNGFVEEDLTDMMEKYGIEYIHLMSTLKNSTEPLDWDDLLNLPQFEDQLGIIAAQFDITIDELRQILIDKGLLLNDGVKDAVRGIFNQVGYTPKTVLGKERIDAAVDELAQQLSDSWSEEDLNLLTLEKYYEFLETPPGMRPTIEELNRAKTAYYEYMQTVEEATETTKRFAFDAVDSLAETESAINSLNELYWETVKKDPNADEDALANWGIADPAKINAVEQAFTKLAEKEDEATQKKLSLALKDFEETLVHFPGDAEKAEDAINNLITTYINESSILDDLTEENQEYIKARLESIGISNAEEVVQSRLNDTVKATTTAIKELRVEYNKYYEILNSADPDTEEYKNAIDDLTSYVSKAIAFYDKDGNISKAFDISPEFVQSHLDTIQKMLNGDEDALRTLQKEAALMEFKANIDINVPDQYINDFFNDIWDLIDWTNLQKIEIGADLDNEAFIAALNQMANHSWEMAEQIAAYFKSIGIDLKMNRQYSKTGGNGMTSEAAKYMDARGPFAGATKSGDSGVGDPAEYGPKPPSSKDKGGGSDKEEEDPNVTAYEEGMKKLEFLRDNNLIDLKEFYDQCRLLAEKYYGGDLEKYAEQYYNAMKEYLNGILELYKSAQSAAVALLDDELDKYEKLEDAEKEELETAKKANDKKIKDLEKLNKNLDKEIKLLEKEQKRIQKESIVPLDDRIKGQEEIKKGLEEELSIMQKQNDKRQDAINLQKAQYELERAQHQKVNLVNTLCQAS